MNARQSIQDPSLEIHFQKKKWADRKVFLRNILYLQQIYIFQEIENQHCWFFLWSLVLLNIPLNFEATHTTPTKMWKRGNMRKKEQEYNQVFWILRLLNTDNKIPNRMMTTISLPLCHIASSKEGQQTHNPTWCHQLVLSRLSKTI